MARHLALHPWPGRRSVDRDPATPLAAPAETGWLDMSWLDDLLSLSPEDQQLADRVLVSVREFLGSFADELIGIALIVAAATLIMGTAEIVLTVLVALGLVAAASAELVLAISASLLAIAGVVAVLHGVVSSYVDTHDRLLADHAPAHPADPEPGLATAALLRLLAVVNVVGLIDLGEALAGVTVAGGQLTIEQSGQRASRGGEQAGYMAGAVAAPAVARGTRQVHGNMVERSIAWFLAELGMGAARPRPLPPGRPPRAPAEEPALPAATAAPEPPLILLLEEPLSPLLLPEGPPAPPLLAETGPPTGGGAMVREADLARWETYARTTLTTMDELGSLAGAVPLDVPVGGPPAGGSGRSDAPLTVVSNRGAFNMDAEATAAAGSPQYQPAGAGGLVTGVKPVVQQTGGVWVAWHGVQGSDGAPFQRDGFTTAPVGLSAEEVDQYYLGAANMRLWPEMHDVGVPAEFDAGNWETYERVNQRFAERAALEAPADSRVWTHDYQLMLVLGRLRQLRPDLDQGYFHHIPWPDPAVMARDPAVAEIMRSLTAADLAGFHTERDVANFIALAQQQGMITEGSNILVPEPAGHVRVAQADRFPISIDYQGFQDKALRPQAGQRAQEIRAEQGGGPILLGVDRLDYSKGIPERLLAFEQLLADGRLPEGTTFLQVATPSRTEIPAYAELKARVEAIVARINETYGTETHVPVNYHYGNIPHDELVAYYLAADVMVVNALRDGMNLVAMEYVVSRHDGGGSLVLSQEAGAAHSLTDAVIVDPNDSAAVQNGIVEALSMPEPERRRRMEAMRSHVRTHDVRRWAQDFLKALDYIGDLNRRTERTHRSRRR